LRKIAKIVAPVVGSIALIGAVQGSAQAAMTTTGQPAPSCVSYVDHYDGMFGGFTKVTVTNGCAATVRVQVTYLTYSSPSECLTIAPNSSVDTTYYNIVMGDPNVRALVTC
jgi:hypothetical protein